MKRLLLFDLDGTLVTSPTTFARVATIRELYGLEVRIEGRSFAGMTEPEILTILLRSEGWDDAKIKKEMPVLIKELGTFYAREFQKGWSTLLPGVKNLLDTLTRPDVTLGLITGNIKVIAQIKLENVGIWNYFSVGGYGDDPHETRGDLVKIGAQRAGFDPTDPGVYVIGDTWRDIKAALEAGVVNRVGLIGPRHPRSEFEEAGATAILSSFVDTQKALEALGIT